MAGHWQSNRDGESDALELCSNEKDVLLSVTIPWRKESLPRCAARTELCIWGDVRLYSQCLAISCWAFELLWS